MTWILEWRDCGRSVTLHENKFTDISYSLFYETISEKLAKFHGDTWQVPAGIRFLLLHGGSVKATVFHGQFVNSEHTGHWDAKSGPTVQGFEMACRVLWAALNERLPKYSDQHLRGMHLEL